MNGALVAHLDLYLMFLICEYWEFILREETRPTTPMGDLAEEKGDKTTGLPV